MAATFKRSRIWVDRPFQLKLLVLCSWYLTILIGVSLQVAFLFFTLGNLSKGVREGLGAVYVDFLAHERFLLFTLVFVLPMLLYSLLRLSHRFAGPLFRCRQLLRMMAEGKIVPEFKPRTNDLMSNYFEDFNLLIRASNARIQSGAQQQRIEQRASDETFVDQGLASVMNDETELQHAGR